MSDTSNAEPEPGYAPGTFGCHELLDRVHLLGDMLEAQVLAHPASALRPGWYSLAARAVQALRELYQQVGAEHLAADNSPSRQDLR